MVYYPIDNVPEPNQKPGRKALERSKTTEMPAGAGVCSGYVPVNSDATLHLLSAEGGSALNRREDNDLGGVALKVVDPVDSDADADAEHVETTRDSTGLEFSDVSSDYSESVDLDNERDQIADDDDAGDDGDGGD